MSDIKDTTRGQPGSIAWDGTTYWIRPLPSDMLQWHDAARDDAEIEVSIRVATEGDWVLEAIWSFEGYGEISRDMAVDLFDEAAIADIERVAAADYRKSTNVTILNTLGAQWAHLTREEIHQRLRAEQEQQST